MTFPHDYPFSPPTFRFIPPIYHPNIYKDGRLCISILHTSGDPMSNDLDGVCLCFYPIYFKIC